MELKSVKVSTSLEEVWSVRFFVFILPVHCTVEALIVAYLCYISADPRICIIKTTPISKLLKSIFLPPTTSLRGYFRLRVVTVKYQPPTIGGATSQHMTHLHF